MRDGQGYDQFNAMLEMVKNLIIVTYLVPRTLNIFHSIPGNSM